MKEKDELKNLIANMNDEQFNWFVDQMQRVLCEEVGELGHQKDCQ